MVVLAVMGAAAAQAVRLCGAEALASKTVIDATRPWEPPDSVSHVSPSPRALCRSVDVMFFPMSQVPWLNQVLLVRTEGAPDELVPALRAALEDIAPDQRSSESSPPESTSGTRSRRSASATS